MKADWIESAQMTEAPDWRPLYHFSPARVLCRIGQHWPRLGELAGEMVDGWRVSTNPASKTYDSRVETAPIYRLRHIGNMLLHTEAEHWQTPEVTEESYCVQPNDIVVRKVGKVSAALVSDLHRRHPIDANLAIIRGLSSTQALWVTYCLNQPLYRSFLETRDSVSSLIRVGIKQLVEMPIERKPSIFDEVANKYLKAQASHSQSQDHLFSLRTEVEDWLDNLMPEHVSFLHKDLEERRCAWFTPDDLQDVLNITSTEQSHFAHSLIEEGGGISIEEVAQINPRHPRVQHEERCKVLRLSDLDDHLGIAKDLIKREDMSWRTQKRQLHQNDILISSFVSEGKIAFITDEVPDCILPTEQLITLCFHRYHGAYALLMESSVVQSQWQRLASGSTQRFVQSNAIKQLVLPVLENNQAKSWHERLIDVLDKRKKAEQDLNKCQDEMYRIYRSVHPVDVEEFESEEGKNNPKQQEAKWQTH